ncbi:lipase maturation factor 2 [Achlya hypogyna]|uniref:Lipase maturation factor 2 n=1 Tax=Achlya hypogyna TaxID=1202772 RepID=A0A1V9ZTR0_ACHHY|nr:lipase maturation factor 2 [Achlya hypogyna]
MHRTSFLRALAAIYGASFASIYLQVQGLYGPDGLEPVASFLNRVTHAKELNAHPGQHFLYYPSLVWFHDHIGLPPDLFLELLCLVGGAAAALAACNIVTTPDVFGVMWASYLSIVLVGQSFLNSAADALLLEVGFLALFLAAPFDLASMFAPPAAIVGCLRFLAFKLALLAGAAKVQSACPTWLGLTAHDFAFATQPLPLPSSWFIHQLPPVVHRISAAASLWVQGPLALLLLSPVHGHRVVAASGQLVLHVGTLCTGNYGVLNLLSGLVTVAATTPMVQTSPPQRSWPHWALIVAGFVAPLAAIYAMFEVVYEDATPTSVRLAWSVSQINAVLSVTVPACLGVAAAGFVIAVGAQLLQLAGRAGQDMLRCRPAWAVALGHCLVASLVGALLFLASSTHVAALDESLALPVWARNAGILASRLHLVAGGSFPGKTTGVGTVTRHGTAHAIVARLEIVLEGSADDGKTWLPYHFKAKPSDIYSVPAIAAVHVPRLDAQLWVAAQGEYNQAPWIVHLADKLLEGSATVKALLDTSRDPFPNTPPKRVRVQLYQYDFTRLNTSWARATPKAVIMGPAMNPSQWWTRKLVKEYMPTLEAKNPSVATFFEAHGWRRDLPEDPPCANSTRPALCHVLEQLHGISGTSLQVAVVVALIAAVGLPQVLPATSKVADRSHA